MKDTETILQAISDLNTKLSGRLDGMEHDITETIKKQLSQETGMKALRNRQFSHSRDIQQIKETLNDLVNSDALISRGRKKAVLNKESVYDRFSEQGLTKHQVLELLDEAGLIFPYSPGNRTSVCWDGNKQASFRAIIIKL
jgi:hypothetical protein